MIGRLFGWKVRRHHVMGASFLATALGVYSFAARLGFVPANISSAVSWVTQSGGPLVAGTPIGGATTTPFTQPASWVTPTAAYPANTAGYPASAGAAAAYPTSGYPAGGNAPSNYAPPAYGGGDIACYFSPSGGCTEAVVNEVRRAQQQIFVQAYSFTSQPIAQALVEAHQRGVAVFIVLDKSQRSEQYSTATLVARAGIPTLIDSAHAIAHNKIMLIDGQTIVTGSFNFTANAERSNAENLLVIRNRPDLYQAYDANFRHHYQHSQPY